MALPAAEVIKQLGGTAKLADLLAHTTRRAVRTAVHRGEVERLTRGVYALPSTLPMQKRAAALHGVLSHQSAAKYWRLESIFEPSATHVTVSRNHRPAQRKGVTLHYGEIDDEEATSPLRTVLDCARSLPFREALAIADSACRRELVTQEELEAGALRQGPGRKRALRVAVHADGRSANPFESAMRAIVIEAGITGFQPQLLIPGTNPRMWVDLGDPERMIVFEADSFAFHGTPQAHDRDCFRYDLLVSRGWLVQRFTYQHVIRDSAWTRATMLATCALRGAASQARNRST